MWCAVEQLLKHPASLFPIALFMLLQDPTFSLQFSRLPECRFDPWTADFMDTYRDDLQGDEAQAVLIFIALFLHVDNIEIERWNAAIRRWLYSRSVHTHSLSVETLDSEWMCQLARLSSKKLQEAVKQVVDDANATDNAPPAKVVRCFTLPTTYPQYSWTSPERRMLTYTHVGTTLLYWPPTPTQVQHVSDKACSHRALHSHPIYVCSINTCIGCGWRARREHALSETCWT